MAHSATPEDHDRPVYRMEKYASAVERGAVGFVLRNHVAGCLPPTGEVGYHERPAPIPAVGVSKEVGRRLEGGIEDVTLSVECRNDVGTSVNTEAVLGPDTDEEVL